ncbi:hypothetical protein Y032_0355g3339 [Ancylostoma ceylanicum]|nr:hypothetical protein Y032_0355g3339 [Ancylostoma ceylanicum]
MMELTTENSFSGISKTFLSGSNSRRFHKKIVVDVGNAHNAANHWRISHYAYYHLSNYHSVVFHNGSRSFVNGRSVLPVPPHMNGGLGSNTEVADVKKKIAEERGDDYAVELQKLIYNGKILDDATTIEQVDIDPNKFVVVMLSRRKVAEPAPAPVAVAAPAPAPAPTPAPSTDSTAAAPEKQTENAPGSAAPAPAVVTAPAGESTPQPAPTQAAPTQPSFTADQESAIDAIQAMGYPRDQVVAALRAAFWNPDRAVEYLLNGIPDEEQIPIEVGGEEEGSEGGEAAASQLEALRQLPQMDELRNLVRSNPEILPSLIQQIAAVNPELMEVIQNNQEEFLRILNAAPGSGSAQPAGGGQAGANPNPYSGRHVIDLTEQEAAAIQRIKSLGFRVSDGLIIEAYLACDKNEEMAIDYILNRMSEDDM